MPRSPQPEPRPAAQAIALSTDPGSPTPITPGTYYEVEGTGTMYAAVSLSASQAYIIYECWPGSLSLHANDSFSSALESTGGTGYLFFTPASTGAYYLEYDGGGYTGVFPAQQYTAAQVQTGVNVSYTEDDWGETVVYFTSPLLENCSSASDLSITAPNVKKWQQMTIGSGSSYNNNEIHGSGLSEGIFNNPSSGFLVLFDYEGTFQVSEPQLIDEYATLALDSATGNTWLDQDATQAYKVNLAPGTYEIYLTSYQSTGGDFQVEFATDFRFTTVLCTVDDFGVGRSERQTIHVNTTGLYFVRVTNAGSRMAYSVRVTTDLYVGYTPLYVDNRVSHHLSEGQTDYYYINLTTGTYRVSLDARSQVDLVIQAFGDSKRQTLLGGSDEPGYEVDETFTVGVNASQPVFLAVNAKAGGGSYYLEVDRISGQPPSGGTTGGTTDGIPGEGIDGSILVPLLIVGVGVIVGAVVLIVAKKRGKSSTSSYVRRLTSSSSSRSSSSRRSSSSSSASRRPSSSSRASARSSPRSSSSRSSSASSGGAARSKFAQLVTRMEGQDLVQARHTLAELAALVRKGVIRLDRAQTKELKREITAKFEAALHRALALQDLEDKLGTLQALLAVAGKYPKIIPEDDQARVTNEITAVETRMETLAAERAEAERQRAEAERKRVEKDRARERQLEVQRLNQLQDIFEASNKVKIAWVAEALGMSEKAFRAKVFEWAKEFEFRVEGEYLVRGDMDVYARQMVETQREVEGIIRDLEGSYPEWGQAPDKIPTKAPDKAPDKSEGGATPITVSETIYAIYVLLEQHGGGHVRVPLPVAPDLNFRAEVLPELHTKFECTGLATETGQPLHDEDLAGTVKEVIARHGDTFRVDFGTAAPSSSETGQAPEDGTGPAPRATRGASPVAAPAGPGGNGAEGEEVEVLGDDSAWWEGSAGPGAALGAGENAPKVTGRRAPAGTPGVVYPPCPDCGGTLQKVGDRLLQCESCGNYFSLQS